MSARDLFALWPRRVMSAYHRYRADHAVHVTQRNLDLIRREIAEFRRAESYLQTELMNLKLERKSK